MATAKLTKTAVIVRPKNNIATDRGWCPIPRPGSHHLVGFCP